MTITYDPSQAAGLEALEILRLMILDDEVSDASRVSAAKALLDRYTPKDNAELKRREAEERDAALTDIRGLLAELATLAAAQPVGGSEPPALAEDRAPATDHAADNA